MKKRGKKYREIVKTLKINRHNTYSIEDASALIKKSSPVKFDATIEFTAKISYRSLQDVRGIIQLPHGTGKKIRIAVFAKGEAQGKAREAGADIVGDADLIEKIQGGFLDFDVAVATPEMMKDVGKLGKILGTRGLMPKPKAGTVTDDVAKAITELRAGRIEYKSDKTGVVSLGIGKVSFEPKKIQENIQTVLQSLLKDKPSDAKGDYIETVFIASTMGPSFRVNHKAVIL